MTHLVPGSHFPEHWQARLTWKTLEPYHAMIYFAPEARANYRAIGLNRFWTGYFASRSAALGQVAASVVAATFFNFHPRMVAQFLADVWHLTTPEQVIIARVQAADAALRRLLGDLVESAEVTEAAELAREAAEACPIAGRPLFAGYCALTWPEQPHLVLWHAATLLREFRGDGHVIALMSEGIDGCEAHLTLAATGTTLREVLQPNRGWSDEEWSAAQTRLVKREILDEAGNLTPSGYALRQAIEERTDQLALLPWRALGEAKCTRLLQLVQPLSARIVEQKGIPLPNPMGVSWP
jgi:helix-turn-helix protein